MDFFWLDFPQEGWDKIVYDFEKSVDKRRKA